MSDDGPAVHPFYIRPLEKPDRNWVAEMGDAHWGSTKIVSRGQVHYIHLLNGFVAVMGQEGENGEKVGLLTFHHDESTQAIEIISLNSLREGIGIAAALLDALKAHVQAIGIKRVWLITTNDNMHALRFYQKRGFVLCALHPNALSESRKLKPQIPLIGHHGIPLRDEIELELRF